MRENGRSEAKAQGFQEPHTSGGGMGVLAIVSTISVVVAAVWVIGPDAHSDPKVLSSPSSQALPDSEIDATITMTGARCELDGIQRPIPPGTLKLELVNDSDLEAHFTVVKLRGPIRELRADPPYFLFRRTRQSSLDPATVEVWSSKVPVEPGRWAVLCHKDKEPSPNGLFIVPVGAAGPLIVGTGGSATELMGS